MRRIDKKAMDVDKSNLRISSSMGISTKIFQQHLLKGLSSSFSMKKGQVVGFSKFVRRNLKRILDFSMPKS